MLLVGRHTILSEHLVSLPFPFSLWFVLRVGEYLALVPLSAKGFWPDSSKGQSADCTQRSSQRGRFMAPIPYIAPSITRHSANTNCIPRFLWTRTHKKSTGPPHHLNCGHCVAGSRPAPGHAYRPRCIPGPWQVSVSTPTGLRVSGSSSYQARLGSTCAETDAGCLCSALQLTPPSLRSNPGQLDALPLAVFPTAVLPVLSHCISTKVACR
jgi:hypothetical protein